MKIGLFGGAFDPITKSHMKLCNYLVDNNLVDEVWIMPCYVSYYDKKMVDCHNRLMMCQIAVDNNKNSKIKVSDYEIANKLSGETYDIVEKLVQDYKEHTFRFVIGLDNALKIHTWSRWEDLAKLTPFIVFPRVVGENHVDNLWCMKEPHVYLASYKADSVSSTQVRKEIRENKFSDLVDLGVCTYVIDHGYYTYSSA
jgi:nicotinate-nucleotide adenylyltransferase